MGQEVFRGDKEMLGDRWKQVGREIWEEYREGSGCCYVLPDDEMIKSFVVQRSLANAVFVWK